MAPSWLRYCVRTLNQDLEPLAVALREFLEQKFADEGGEPWYTGSPNTAEKTVGCYGRTSASLFRGNEYSGSRPGVIRRWPKWVRIASVTDSFDDVPLSDVLEPAITVISQDPVALGTLAAERVFARLAGDTSPAHEYVLPTYLVARGSGEIPPHV